MKGLALIASLAALALAGCGDTDSAEDPKSDEPQAKAASPSALTKAYGGLAGTCMSVESFGMDVDYEMRQGMRDQLQVITESAEADPAALSADGQTAEEILFDLLPTVKNCDKGLAAETQAAIDRLP